MRAVLAIAGCGPRLEVALLAGEGIPPGSVRLAGPTPRSDLIMAAVDLLLQSAGLPVHALGGVVATRGPGSFTGIRVGLATAQGLATALAIPARGFSSLLAQAARCEEDSCLAVQPARRGSVYAQPFVRAGRAPNPTAPPSVVTTASLATSRQPVVGPDVLELPPGTPVPRTRLTLAEALLVLFHDSPENEAPLVPLYVEAAAAEVARWGA
ncbi:MAG: tRNA (adenosine(37)-N6)-threonylcarbamoyltransferase complex dimerization subunit type 1 TsaB [Acidobacteriota bacterium]